jgi:hypothetical protein
MKLGGLGRGEYQRETYSRRLGGLIAGETVTPGDYRCQSCEHVLRVEDRKVASLPVCPACQGEHWELG